jgi:hypothetical protein
MDPHSIGALDPDPQKRMRIRNSAANIRGELDFVWSNEVNIRITNIPPTGQELNWHTHMYKEVNNKNYAITVLGTVTAFPFLDNYHCIL